MDEVRHAKYTLATVNPGLTPSSRNSPLSARRSESGTSFGNFRNTCAYLGCDVKFAIRELKTEDSARAGRSPHIIWRVEVDGMDYG